MIKILSLAFALGCTAIIATAQNPITRTEASTPVVTFAPITLPYSLDALAPVISKQTMELHYGKHLAGYAKKLNALIVGTAFEHEKSLEEIVRKSDGAIYNNAGQLLNHNLYFEQFNPRPEPISGDILDKIKRQWGSFEAFQKRFEQLGSEIFGSGWLWLAQEKNGDLSIVQLSNGGNPLSYDITPLLGIDVWEHAYYLDYQNRRVDHLKALWSIIDWRVVNSRLKK